MAKPISPRWSNAAAGSLSSRVIRAGTPLASWLGSTDICVASPFPPAQHHFRSRHGICRLRDTAQQARHHQLFLPAVSALAERRRGKLQWTDTALPTLQHRHCTAVGQRDPGRCRSPQQHASQVPGLPHSVRSPGRANRPPQGRINFAIRGGARPTPDEMLRITSGVALQIETACW